MTVRFRRTWCLSLAVAVCLAAASALPVSAEIVTLSSGRTLSVRSHHLDGATLVLVLRGGGEIRCEPSVVSAFAPDEVPHPEDAPPAPAARAADPDAPFADLIAAAAHKHGLNARLLESVIRAESNFAERARSPKGAMGLMQLMPGTARQYDVNDPYDAAANIDAGARHLRSLLDQFELPVALAAYNAGEAAIRRFGGVPPYPETRSYVRRILAFTGQPLADR
jgi:soluble lytic murein transglycosylase-like protein